MEIVTNKRTCTSDVNVRVRAEAIAKPTKMFEGRVNRFGSLIRSRKSLKLELFIYITGIDELNY
jgi:hypothetical protein